MTDPIEKPSSPLSAWGICFVLLLATFLNYMDRQVLAVTLPTLKQTYHLTESRVGMLEGTFGFAFAAGSLFFGWLADRLGPKFLYPAVLAGWSIAGIATSWAGSGWVESSLASSTDPPGRACFAGCLAVDFCSAFVRRAIGPAL